MWKVARQGWAARRLELMLCPWYGEAVVNFRTDQLVELRLDSPVAASFGGQVYLYNPPNLGSRE